ncbi:hypothetical protein OUZ56_015096 [Daphnia magna]|uniref:Uncharacterized protein n=1 Tax=Daphnia magna TaxID=35525 RepID=A0ABR0ALS6_9CRUS|nr:hypothetical protein OUZ56_015096 [Daphnia magna]
MIRCYGAGSNPTNSGYVSKRGSSSLYFRIVLHGQQQTEIQKKIRSGYNVQINQSNLLDQEMSIQITYRHF